VAAENGSTELAKDGAARQLELLVKLTVHSIRGERNLTEMIVLLGGLGFKVAEISSVLGAPKSSVAPILSRAGKRASSGAKAKRGKR